MFLLMYLSFKIQNKYFLTLGYSVVKVEYGNNDKEYLINKQSIQIHKVFQKQ